MFLALAQSGVKVFLLGAPRIERGGALLALDRRKAIALLAYLALTKCKHSRDALATMFWPDSDQARARAALRQTLSTVVHAVGGGVLAVDREVVGYCGASHVWIDAVEFARAVPVAAVADHNGAANFSRGAEFSAVDLYGGDFLAGFSLTDAPEFDRWQLQTADELRRQLGVLCARAVQAHIAIQHYDPAMEVARKWLIHDPTAEDAHRSLMRALALSGQRNAALKHYQACVETLRHELGVPPSPETTELFIAITEDRLNPPGPGASDDATLPGGIAFPNREMQRTNYLLAHGALFVGRAQELAHISRLVLDNTDCRLLTLVGPGGMGKTRLAIEAARGFVGAFPHGVFFVALAALESTALLEEAIAESVGFSFYHQSNPRNQLLNYLREKELLLLLDNFEHLLAGAPLLAEILATAPGVKMLVTSRERLHLQAEWILDVDGLDTPESAMRLFSLRAQQVQPQFDPLREAAHVSRIAQLVGGMPLALEMAAPWARVLTIEQIADEIERSLDFLQNTLADAPERHRNMRAIFEQSWRFLSDEERPALARLAVFRGGFTHAAASAVAGAGISTLATFADRALLRTSGDGRFEMHELLRQFALEQLRGLGLLDGAMLRHAHFFATQLRAATDGLFSPTQIGTLRALSAELENIRASWNWAVARLDGALIDEMIDGLHAFYARRTWLAEAEGVFAAALTALHAGPDQRLAAPVLRRLHIRHAHCSMRLSQLAQAQSELEAVIDGWPDDHQQNELALALGYLGDALRLRGSATAALAEHARALALARTTGDARLLAGVLNLHGIAAYAAGDHALARELYEEGREAWQRIGDAWSLALITNNTGLLATSQGAYTEARQLFERSHAIWQEFGAHGLMAQALDNLGIVAMNEGRLLDAVETLLRAIALHRSMGNAQGAAVGSHNLATAQLKLNEPDKAFELWQACQDEARALGDRTLLPLVLCGLAELDLRRGELAQVAGNIDEALAIAFESRSAYALLNGFVQAGGWHVARGHRARGLDLLGYVLGHASSTEELRNDARERLMRLGAQHDRRTDLSSQDILLVAADVMRELQP